MIKVFEKWRLNCQKIQEPVYDIYWFAGHAPVLFCLPPLFRIFIGANHTCPDPMMMKPRRMSFLPLAALLFSAMSVVSCGGPGLGNSVNAEYWYEQGRRQYLSGDCEQAAVSFARAEDLATDNYSKALIFRDLAQVYGISLDHRQEAEYMERAAEAFAMAGDSQESNLALLAAGQTYADMNEFDRAEGLYKSVMFGAGQDRDTLLQARCLEACAALCLSGSRQDPVQALEILTRVTDEFGVPLSGNGKGIAAYAYSLIGESALSDKWLQEAVRSADGEDETTRIRFREYQIKSRDGDTEGALRALEAFMAASSEAERRASRQSALSSQKEFFRQQSEVAAERLRTARMRQWVMGLLLAFGLIAGWFIYRIYRLRAEQLIARERAETDRVMSIAEDLQARLRKADASSTKILEKSGLSVLERLCEQFYIYEGTDNLQTKVLKEAKSVIDGLRTDTAGLEEWLDASHDGLMTAFRAQFPKLKEDDLKLFAYVASGFSSTTISTFMERDKQNVYNRIWRLKNRIAASDVPDRDRFLSFFNK